MFQENLWIYPLVGFPVLNFNLGGRFIICVFIFYFSEGLVSYSMPQGVQRGSELDLTDRTYDGREDGGYLSGGLGQLVDGQKGPDNFRDDLNGNGKGKKEMSKKLFSYSIF